MIRVDTDPRITAFTTPSNILTDQQLQLSISGQGGTGTISYSYTGLPPRCVSMNSPSISCSPTSSGTYRVTATITDASEMTDTTYTDITVTQPILGFAPTIGYAVIAGIAIAAGAGATIATMLTHQKRRIAPTQKTLTVSRDLRRIGQCSRASLTAERNSTRSLVKDRTVTRSTVARRINGTKLGQISSRT